MTNLVSRFGCCVHDNGSKTPKNSQTATNETISLPSTPQTPSASSRTTNLSCLPLIHCSNSVHVDRDDAGCLVSLSFPPCHGFCPRPECDHHLRYLVIWQSERRHWLCESIACPHAVCAADVFHAGLCAASQYVVYISKNDWLVIFIVSILVSFIV